MHDGLIAHAHSHTAVTDSGSVALNSLLASCLATFLTVAHLLSHVVLLVVVWLASGALRTMVVKALLGPLQLGLLVRLHRTLLFRASNNAIWRVPTLWVPDVDLGRCEAYHSNLVFLTLRGRRIQSFVVGDLLALTAL